MQDTSFVEDPIPFEEEDPELGDLVGWFSTERPLTRFAEEHSNVYKAFLHPEVVEIIYYNRPSAMKGVGFILNPSAGRNDACPCGSGKKFKKCCNRS